jgi:hypothetical protein
MRYKIKEEETNSIIAECVENPDITVGEISEKHKITVNLAFYIVTEAGKQLKSNGTCD